MSFIIRTSNSTARLLRRTWVPKGANGNTHPYAQDTAIGSLPMSVTALPPGFPEGHAPLTLEELAALERKIFEPARQRERVRLHEVREQQLDPQRRVTAAIALLHEAIPLTGERPLAPAVLHELANALSALQVTGSLTPPQDPLQHLLAAILEATGAVEQGCYGTRPAEVPLKTSPVNATWTEARHAMLGSGEGSLIRALQRGGWVKTADASK